MSAQPGMLARGDCRVSLGLPLEPEGWCLAECEVGGSSNRFGGCIPVARRILEQLGRSDEEVLEKNRGVEPRHWEM